MPAVPGGRPARPAGRHPGPAASTPGNGEGAHEVTARDHPAPAPAGLPLRQGRAARQPRPAAQPARGAFPLSPFPGPAAPGSRRPPPARRGPDLTRRAERSVRRRGPTDGPPPGTPTAPGRPPATPAEEPGTPGDPLLTIEEVTAELRVSRAAFYRWRRQGAGPPAGAAAGRRGAGPAQRAHRVAAPPGRRRDRRTGARQQMDSYDVRFWDTKKIADNASGGRYRVRWAVDGREHCKSFKTRPSPTGSSTTSRTPPATGGPSAPAPACPPPRPPRGRWSPGTSTPAPTPRPSGRTSPRSPAGRSPRPWSPSPSPLPRRRRARPSRRVLRQALFAWAFNPATRDSRPAARDRRSPSAGPPAPRCRVAELDDPPPCGSRSARAPRP